MTTAACDARATPPRAAVAATTVVAAGGRRELNRRRTRQSIAEATASLVAEHGYAAVTVDMIAEAAEVSPRTFNNYFDSKEDALFSGDPDVTAVIAAAFAAQPAGAPLLDVLRGVLIHVAADMTVRGDEMARRIAILHANPALLPAFRARFARVEATLTQSIAERLGMAVDGAEDRRPRLLAELLGSLWRGSVEHWRAGDRLADLPELVSSSFDLLVTTLATPPALPAR